MTNIWSRFLLPTLKSLQFKQILKVIALGEFTLIDRVMPCTRDLETEKGATSLKVAQYSFPHFPRRRF